MTIFRSDLLACNGIQKNCQIIRVGAKLHNFVINADNLNFLNVSDDDYESLEVECLPKVTFHNNGYYPTVTDTNKYKIDDQDKDRRNAIVESILEMELSRPDYNVDRNNSNN